MTKYWPLSAVMTSPFLRPEQKVELMNYKTCGLSDQTMEMCRHITERSSGLDITMLYTDGMPLKRVYMQCPTREEWLRLERSVFIDTGSIFGLNVDSLH